MGGCLDFSFHSVWCCIDNNHLSVHTIFVEKNNPGPTTSKASKNYPHTPKSRILFQPVSKSVACIFCSSLQCLADAGWPWSAPTQALTFLARSKSGGGSFLLCASISKLQTQSRSLAPALRQPAGKDGASFSPVGIKGLNQEIEAGLNLDEKCCILPPLCQGSFLLASQFALLLSAQASAPSH